MAKFRLLVVEDHTLLRQGLVSMISSDDTFEVVGEAMNGKEGVHEAKRLKPDLILMDINMPIMNGTEALADIKKYDPKIKVLMLTAHTSDEYVHDVMKLGADGYLLKHATREEFLHALKHVLSGKTYIYHQVADGLMNSMLNGGKSKLELLSTRERQVLKLVAEGETNKSISEIMHVSIKTVEKHRANLMKKLDIRNSVSLTAFAIEKGIV